MGFFLSSCSILLLLSCCVPLMLCLELNGAATQALRPVQTTSSQSRLIASFIEEVNILLEDKGIRASEKEGLDLSIAERENSIAESTHESRPSKRCAMWRNHPPSSRQQPASSRTLTGGQSPPIPKQQPLRRLFSWNRKPPADPTPDLSPSLTDMVSEEIRRCAKYDLVNEGVIDPAEASRRAEWKQDYAMRRQAEENMNC